MSIVCEMMRKKSEIGDIFRLLQDDREHLHQKIFLYNAQKDGSPLWEVGTF